MSFRVKRRLQQQGGSLLVTLPRIWVTGKGLRAGDQVEIWFDQESCRITAQIMISKPGELQKNGRAQPELAAGHGGEPSQTVRSAELSR